MTIVNFNRNTIIQQISVTITQAHYTVVIIVVMRGRTDILCSLFVYVDVCGVRKQLLGDVLWHFVTVATIE